MVAFRCVRRLALATVLAASGCPLVAAQSASAAETVRIGAPLPVTGALSPEGGKLRQGYELWLDQVKRAGGLTVGGKKEPVELVYDDYESSTPKAAQLTEKLIVDDKVAFVFAPFGSGATKAASAVAEKYGVPMLASSASSAEVFDQGYKNLFGVYTDNSTLSDPVAALIVAKAPQVKRVAILARNDLYPLSLAQDFAKAATKNGMTVVFNENYAIGTLDHASSLTVMRAAKPDWIVVTGYINDLILVRKEMGDLKIAATAVTMINGPAYKEWIDATGPLSQNVITAAWFDPAERYTSKDVFGSTENFVSLFKAKYGTAPDFTQAAGAAVGVVLQMAIERAGSLDRDKVRAELAKGGFDTFFGPISFDKTGMANSYTPPILQIQNGQVRVIAPAAIKDAELKLGVD